MTTTTEATDDLEVQIGTYAEHLFGTGLAAFEAVSINLGREIGLYRTLEDRGASTATEIADAAGIHPRYAREWLEQQAVAGYIAVENLDAGPEERRYSLPTAAAICLNDPDSLASIGPIFDFFGSLPKVLPALVRAFREGGGVPYADYGIHEIQGDFNRPAFLKLLTAEWIPSVPGLVEKLSAPRARVAEIGSGAGWAAIAIAKAFPGIHVDGFDLDDASVAVARKNAADAGLADRVRFEVADVADTSAFEEDGYDFVLALEMVHDLARPVAALRTMRRLGKPDAVHLVMDERVAEKFEAPTENPIERLFYVASVLHCLPAGMAEQPSAGTGTVMRPATLRSYAVDAGFSDLEILPIDHDMFRFYRLATATDQRV